MKFPLSFPRQNGADGKLNFMARRDRGKGADQLVEIRIDAHLVAGVSARERRRQDEPSGFFGAQCADNCLLNDLHTRKTGRCAQDGFGVVIFQQAAIAIRRPMGEMTLKERPRLAVKLKKIIGEGTKNAASAQPCAGARRNYRAIHPVKSCRRDNGVDALFWKISVFRTRDKSFNGRLDQRGEPRIRFDGDDVREIARKARACSPAPRPKIDGEIMTRRCAPDGGKDRIWISGSEPRIAGGVGAEIR